MAVAGRGPETSANGFPILVDAIRKLAASANPGEAAHAVLDACRELAGADGGRVFLLSLTTGQYESTMSVGRVKARTEFDFPRDPAAAAAGWPLEQAVLTGEPVLSDPSRAPFDYESRLVVPAMRNGTTCVGLVDLHSASAGHFSGPPGEELRSLVNLLELVFDRRSTLRHLRAGTASLRYDQGERQFHDDLLLYAASASQMEYLTLRDRTQAGTLRCVATWGYPEAADLSAFDLLDLSEYPPFDEVVRTGQPMRCSDVRQPGFASLWAHNVLRVSRSLVVVPVLVGGDLYGVLSFGARVPFEYSDTEMTSFQTIANAVGVMLDHYRIFHGSVMRAAASSSMAIAMTGVEIAQIARHEARNGIDRIQLVLTDIDRYLSRSPAIKADEIRKYVDDVDMAAGEIVSALDKIRVGTAPVRSDFRDTTIQEIWSSVRYTCEYKLRSLGVAVRYDGPSLPVHVAPDWFRQIFYNLMLNSLDAFDRGRRKGGRGPRDSRRIVLTVSRPAEKAHSVHMTYSDSAGGINPAELRSTDGMDIDDEVGQAIFAPNVTSKEQGSGWGLTLVRNILLQYGGSIDLVEYRRGVSFRITLPRQLLVEAP